MKLERKTSLFISFIVVLTVLLFFWGIRGNDSENMCFIWDDIVLDCYEGELRDLQGEIYAQNGVDYMNPWIMAANGIHYVRKGDDEKAEMIMDTLMSTYYRNNAFPRDEYQQYEDGWVSCMDAPTVAVLSELLYERTGHTKYKKYINDLIPYMTMKSDRGGYCVDIDGRKWFLEYCDKNTNIDNAEFVLNGSLIGTLGTYIIGITNDDENLLTVAKQQTELYKSYCDEYFYNDDAWCYYMRGNGKTINQDHYVIFEIRILNALYEVTKDTFYMEEATRRVDMMKRYYKLFYDASDNYYFVRMGAPHYYYIDIYSTRLSFFDANMNLLCEEIKDGRNYEDSILSGRIPSDTEYITWSIVSPYYNVNMGALTRTYVDRGIADLKATYRVDENGILQNGIVVYSKDSDKQRIRICAEMNQPIEYEAIYGLEIDNQSDENYSMDVILYDSQGNGSTRTLPELIPGKNICVFSYIGCKESPQFKMKEIDSVMLRIHLHDKTEFELSLGHLLKFDNPYYLYKYLDESEYKINFGNK